MTCLSARLRAAATASEGFGELPISLRRAQRAGDPSGLHKDPFDRMLIAQALAENMTLVSNERAFDAYAVKRLCQRHANRDCVTRAIRSAFQVELVAARSCREAVSLYAAALGTDCALTWLNASMKRSL